MKIRVTLAKACSVILLGACVGCASKPAKVRTPSVAIVLSPRGDHRPAPAEITEIHQLLQPEIERRGYVMAKSSRAADYFVYVRYPIDPGGIGGISFVRAEPTVPFLREYESEAEGRQRAYKSAIADMVKEPR